MTISCRSVPPMWSSRMSTSGWPDISRVSTNRVRPGLTSQTQFISLSTASSDPLCPSSDHFLGTDANDLIVPFEGGTDFMFIAVFQSHPATIPCKATNSRAQVSLWKVPTMGPQQQIIVNNTLGVSYNPKKGFHFEYPRWDADNSLLECKVELNGVEQVSQISIHWTSKWSSFVHFRSF